MPAIDSIMCGLTEAFIAGTKKGEFKAEKAAQHYTQSGLTSRVATAEDMQNIKAAFEGATYLANLIKQEKGL